MMRATPDIAVSFVADHEGLRLKAYPDEGGVWTIGYGHTGLDVYPGLAITRARATELLRQDLNTAAARLARVVKAPIIEELTDRQYAALLSFVFNVGANSSWTIWKRLNARAFDQVPIELMRFVNANGHKVQGLVNRRAAEVVLWSTEEPGSVNESPPSSVTREASTPPTSADPTPAAKDAGLITTVVAAVSTTATAVATQTPAAIQQVVTAVQPYASQSQWAERIIQVLATIAAVVAILGVVLTWLKKRRARKQ